jgi:hypothetical protein
MKRLYVLILGAVLLVTPACDSSGPVNTSSDEALARACDTGDLAEVQRQISLGADVNDGSTRYARKRMPLALAVHRRHTAIIEVLEKAGAREWY